jgi:Leu/Phe-tRNA-protein transferase
MHTGAVSIRGTAKASRRSGGVPIREWSCSSTSFGRRARCADASKVCLATLVALLRDQRMTMIDCQQETEHLASLGARPIARAEFVRLLSQLVTPSTTPSGFTTGRVEEAV